ncbi:hypothetical protein [Streptomyces sp. NPDC020965]|uniref:hypothetical protein n=1 Tax=Streptomyces sp. NPDC020965 TaxID=3365105 RepID=UPI0037A462C7
MIFWIPAAVGAAGLLGVNYAVDPLLTPKRNVTPRRVSRMLNSMMITRLLAAGATAASGLVVGVAAQSDPSVLVGSGAAVVMIAHWWPGKTFTNTVRAKLAPAGAAQLVGPAMRPVR